MNAIAADITAADDPMMLRGIQSLVLALALAACAPAHAQLRGHGGPVRAVAVSADGAGALSGSFDTSAIRWSPTGTPTASTLGSDTLTWKFAVPDRFVVLFLTVTFTV